MKKTWLTLCLAGLATMGLSAQSIAHSGHEVSGPDIYEQEKIAAFQGRTDYIPYFSSSSLEQYADPANRIPVNGIRFPSSTSNPMAQTTFAGNPGKNSIDSLIIDGVLNASYWGALTLAEDNSSLVFSMELEQSDVPNDGGFYTYYKGLHFTYYDDDLKPVKTFYLPTNDTTFSITVQSQVSTSYFNTDDKMEFMIQVHSFGPGDGPAGCYDTIFVVNEDGEILGRIGHATSASLHSVPSGYWDEKRVQVYDAYYSSIDDTLYSRVYRATDIFNEEAEPLYTFRMAENLTTYMNAPFWELYYMDGTPYYISCRYEKPFIANGNQQDPIVEMDNRFKIFLYNTDFSLFREFSLPLPGIESNEFSMSSLAYFGNYRISQKTFNPDDKYEILYGMSRYNVSCDCEQLQLYLMDEDGNILQEIADGIADIYQLQPLPGQSDEFAFLMGGGTAITDISMVKLPSLEKTLDFPAIYNGDLLSTYFERIPSVNGGYEYVFGLSRGDNTATTTYGGIAHYDQQGNLVKKVRIDLGKNSLFFEPIISRETVNPYAFLADAAYEYLYFRRDMDDNGVLASFFGVANEDTTVYLWQNDERGSLSGAGIKTDAAKTKLSHLYVTYAGDSIRTYFYRLPLEAVTLQGEGTTENPYIITTPAELDMVRDYPEACFILANDLDMAAYTGLSGSGFQPIPTFSGQFDGQNHIIKNLLLSGQALFSSLSATGSIQNLSLHDIYFKEGSTVGGILCATMTGGNIFNCHVESDLDIQSASSYIGGLVGQANANAIISQCSYTGDITAGKSSYIGGITGRLNSGSQISNCVAKGTIQALNYIGGIAGSTANGSLITNTYSQMRITAAQRAGGIAGSNQGDISKTHASGNIFLADSPEAGYLGYAAGIAGETAFGMQGSFINQSFALNDTIVSPRQVARVAYTEAYTNWQGFVAMDSNFAMAGMVIGTDSTLAVASDTNCQVNRRNGLSGTMEDFNQAFYESVGWQFGQDSLSPWTMSGNKPRLWFEFKVQSVELPVVETTLFKDSSFTLTPIIYPADATDKTVFFSSADNSIASVNQEGVVKGINAGTTTISVRTADGGYTASCEVKVEIPVTQIILPDEILVPLNGSTLLPATILPEDATNKNLTFISLNHSIVTTYGSALAGVALGSTQVIAVSESGDASDTCTARVIIPLEALYLNESSITLNNATPSFQLRVTTYPEDATEMPLVWSSDNESVATVDGNGLVRGHAKGSSTVTVATEDGLISTSCYVNVTENVANEAADASALSARLEQDCFRIECRGSLIRAVEIYNVTGVKMFQDRTLSSNVISVPVQGWSNGLYLIQVTLENGQSAVLKLNK